MGTPEHYVHQYGTPSNLPTKVHTVYLWHRKVEIGLVNESEESQSVFLWLPGALKRLK